MMRMIAILASSAVQAETVTCNMTVPCEASQACGTTGRSLTFTIDRSQFAPAHDASEPPRRKVTTVQFGNMQFPAEPFLIGDTRGFSAEALGGAQAMFVMQPDGSAAYTVARTGERLTGTCEVIR